MPLILEVLETLDRDKGQLEIYRGRCNNVWVVRRDGICTIFKSATRFGEYVYEHYKDTTNFTRRKVCDSHVFDHRWVKEASDYEEITLVENGTDQTSKEIVAKADRAAVSL